VERVEELLRKIFRAVGLGRFADVLAEVVKFGFAGLGATVVFYTVYNVLFAVVPAISTGTAFLLANVPAIATSYVISKLYVFDSNSKARLHTEILMFFSLNGIAIAIGYFALGAVEAFIGRQLGVVGRNVVPAVAILASWGLRFMIARRFIFRSHLQRPAIDSATEAAHLAAEHDAAARDAGPGGNDPVRSVDASETDR
jgi:putative flippase GtrA